MICQVCVSCIKYTVSLENVNMKMNMKMDMEMDMDTNMNMNMNMYMNINTSIKYKYTIQAYNMTFELLEAHQVHESCSH